MTQVNFEPYFSAVTGVMFIFVPDPAGGHLEREARGSRPGTSRGSPFQPSIAQRSKQVSFDGEMISILLNDFFFSTRITRRGFCCPLSVIISIL